MPENTLFSYRTDASDDQVCRQDFPLWDRAEKADIDRYWNGKSAIKEKGADWKNLTEVRSCWNTHSVYFFFRCWFDQLNINPQWPAEKPVQGLWEKDVVEVFLRPDSCADYFEIEVSPLGQWLDAHVRKPRVDVDFAWSSNLRRVVTIDHKTHIWLALIALPFTSFLGECGSQVCPAIGDAWRLNLYRMAGEGDDREYLAWNPTFTARPDFHVPTAFGNLIFLDD